MLGMLGATEHISLVCGAVLFASTVPLVGPVVFGAVVWEAVDRGFDGGFYDSGKELSGLLLGKVAPWWNRATQEFNQRFVKRAEDAYMMNCIYLQGVVVPLLFLCCFYVTQLYGFSLTLAYVYHVLRIGPYFMNFAYCYTLCHKEGHSFTGLYSKPYNSSVMLRNVFNWWIGLFYGVLPAAFAFGHSINHHKYNNGPKDVVSTSDKPRDSFVHFVAYLPRWTLYSMNLSSTIQFLREGNYSVAGKMVLGTLYWAAWGAIWAAMNPAFAAAYIGYPFLENVVLLACVNWSWHAFINPDDPEDEYVGSMTILDGPINVLNEDFHVVHHQYPGEHWTRHAHKAKQHWDEYVNSRATCFRGTHAFEIFGMVVARDYDMLARKFVDLKGERDGDRLSHDDIVKLLKARLRACWWGPRKSKTIRLQGKEVGNLMDGKAVDGTYGKLGTAHISASLAQASSSTSSTTSSDGEGSDGSTSS